MLCEGAMPEEDASEREPDRPHIGIPEPRTHSSFLGRLGQGMLRAIGEIVWIALFARASRTYRVFLSLAFSFLSVPLCALLFWVAQHTFWGISVLITALTSAYVASLCRFITTEHHQDRYFGRMLRDPSKVSPAIAFFQGRFGREVFAVFLLLSLANTVILAVGVFASATYLLGLRLVELVTSHGGIVTPLDAAGLYLWHLFDLVPALEIDATLRWTPPVKYGDTYVGALVLVFKLGVVIVIAAALRSFVKAWPKASSASASDEAR